MNSLIITKNEYYILRLPLKYKMNLCKRFIEGRCSRLRMFVFISSYNRGLLCFDFNTSCQLSSAVLVQCVLVPAKMLGHL